MHGSAGLSDLGMWGHPTIALRAMLVSVRSFRPGSRRSGGVGRRRSGGAGRRRSVGVGRRRSVGVGRSERPVGYQHSPKRSAGL